jgi:predicted aspartyl protease
MTRRLLFELAAVAAIGAGAAGARGVDPRAAAVLAANHAVVGNPTAAGTLRLDYVHVVSGMTGETRAAIDLAAGAFVDSDLVGPTSGGDGFDGRIPWMRDLSGANTAEQGGDRVQLAVNAAYRNANLWWRRDASGAGIAYAGRETIDGHALDHLVVTPAGGKPFDAWFDADTHLLTRIAENQAFLDTQTLYSDYRREGPVLLAHTEVFDEGTGPDDVETFKLQSASFGPAQPLAAYARPTAAPGDVSFDGGAASVTLPFRFLNHHIYIQGMVNGKGPYTFLVDTGGHTLLSPHVVADAGLTAEGSGVGSGVDPNTVTTAYAKVGEIRFGPMAFRDQTAIVIDIYDPAVEGIAVDGMIGFELFRRTAVRIDYGARTITFADPARASFADAGTEIPFKFYDHRPQIEGEVAGVSGLFDIDTGSRTEVDVTSPTVARAGLRQKYPHGAIAMTGWGVGGPSRAYVVRLASLSLGGVSVDQPVVGFSSAKAGSFNDPNFVANIGSGLLQRFVVSFDYAHQRLFLKPIIPPPEDAGRFDRSGLWINAAADGYAVVYVTEGGPAAQAGIVVGDVITALDGKPAAAAGLPDARAMLRARPAGSTVTVDLKRAAGPLRVQMVLRDQV